MSNYWEPWDYNWTKLQASVYNILPPTALIGYNPPFVAAIIGYDMRPLP